MSMDLRYDLGSVQRLAARIGELGDMDTRPLMDEMGSLGASQTQRRIDSEKTAPDGTPWAPWSESYAKTRHGGHSLLVAEQNLLDSIEHIVGLTGDFVEWGSNLVYATSHQNGLDISVIGSRRRITVPARPYLGLSAENEEDMAALVDDFVDRQMRELQ